MISRRISVGEMINPTEAQGAVLIPVNKTEAMPPNTLITRVNILDLREGSLIIHYGGATGPMYKNAGTNVITAEVRVNAVFTPR